MSQNKQRVVGVGGGYGGVAVTKNLERRIDHSTTEITLVNEKESFLLTPVLSLVAGGRVDPANATAPLRSIVRRTTVIIGSVESVDLESKRLRVRLSSGAVETVQWDRMVLALGSRASVPALPGAEVSAISVKTLDNAIEMRRHVLNQMKLAAETRDPLERAARLTCVVVGGGSTGTELVTALQKMVRRAVVSGEIAPATTPKWILVHRHDRLLSELDERLSRTAYEVLTAQGVQVRLGVSLTSAGPSRVQLSDGEYLRAYTVIWTAGVSANPLVSQLKLPTDDVGRVLVNSHLAVTSHPDVFAVGDSAHVPRSVYGQPAPPTAYEAKYQGRTCAVNVAASLGRGVERVYRSRVRGPVVLLSDWCGLGQVAGVRLTGFPGWAALIVNRFFLMPTCTSRRRVLRDLTFRPSRLGRELIAGGAIRPQPGVTAHLSDADGSRFPSLPSDLVSDVLR